MYNELREAIVSGGLPAGARLVESELEEQFALSRTPIRSALHRLAAEGYVVSAGEGKKFLRVTPLNLDDGMELFEMVGHFEGIAARKAAGLDRRPRTALTSKLRSYNRKIAAAATATVIDSMVAFRLDIEFHRAFVLAGAGGPLLHHYDVLMPQVERYGRLYINAYLRHREESLAEHDLIVTAIESGNPMAAQAAAEQNWLNSADRLSSVLRPMLAAGAWE